MAIGILRAFPCLNGTGLGQDEMISPRHRMNLDCVTLLTGLCTETSVGFKKVKGVRWVSVLSSSLEHLVKIDCFHFYAWFQGSYQAPSIRAPRLFADDVQCISNSSISQTSAAQMPTGMTDLPSRQCSRCESP